MANQIHTLRATLPIGGGNKTRSNIPRYCTARFQFIKGNLPLVLGTATPTPNGCVSIKQGIWSNCFVSSHGPGITCLIYTRAATLSARKMIGQYCLLFEIFRTRNLNRPLLKKDYQYGFRVWCRKYSKEDDPEGGEDFTFFPPGQPTEGFSSHPFGRQPLPSAPLEEGPRTREELEEREEGGPLEGKDREDTSTPKGDEAGHELSFNYWLSSKGGPSSGTSRNKKEEGTSEAPETSEALIYPLKSQSPFSELQMKELQEKLHRHKEAIPPRQVGGNRPPIPEPSEIHTAGTSSRAQPVRGNQPEPKRKWWKSLLCLLCRGSKAREDTPSGNEGKGRDTDTGSGEDAADNSMNSDADFGSGDGE